MYLRSTPRRNKDGSEVRYLQLAHNVWDPQLRRSKVQVVYNFGREDATNRDALQRLVASITRFLDPAAALAAAAEGLEFTESRPLGGTWALDALWSQLGIGPVLRKLLKGRRLDDSAERVLFALVANRALAPSSKLAAARWISDDVLIPGLPATSDDACYRAMGWLLEIKDQLERKVFDNLAGLLNLEVDLLFFDTASTYFVTEEADEPVARDKNGNAVTSENTDGEEDGAREPAGFRTWGKSKDHRDDLPQVVIGMAVTRDGIPVRVWCWPGNTSDSALIRQVKDDMRDWCLARVIWVADRDAAARARMIAQLEEAIRDSDQLSRDKRAELRGVISTRPGLNRYLRVTPGGLLRTGAAKAKAEENLDGKYLLRTADPKLSAEDIAAGYKQLLEVERGWRDMKQVIDLRPVYHRREDRIRAHVLLCWLALLLARIAENACGDTWPNLRRELDRIHVGTFAGPAGTFRQRTEITKPQRDILHALKIDTPPRIYQLKPSMEP